MNNIILTGFMGCGKSTVGIRLSYRLKMPYLDTDKLIEKEQNRSICEIFETEGEAYFRLLEKECVEKLLQTTQNTIISVGGGLIAEPGLGDMLKKLGKILYFEISPEGIYKRLENDTSRPLLMGEEPLEKIRMLMEKRKPIYEAYADIIIPVEDRTFEDIICTIQEELDENIGDEWTQP